MGGRQYSSAVTIIEIDIEIAIFHGDRMLNIPNFRQTLFRQTIGIGLVVGLGLVTLLQSSDVNKDLNLTSGMAAKD